jgi:hypothetical protein
MASILLYLKSVNSSKLHLVWLQTSKQIENQKMKLSKTMLAVLGTGLLSCALFGQHAQAALVTGNINFAGSVRYDTNSLATATRVNTWFDVFHNAGFSNVTGGATGDFAVIPAGTQAAMAQPWIFNPSTATPALWSVGGFTFDLTSSSIDNQTATDLTISGIGIVSGNGFDDTAMNWMFTSQNAGGRNMQEFSFSANSNSVPDGGSTVAFLGLGLTCVWMIRRKFVTA